MCRGEVPQRHWQASAVLCYDDCVDDDLCGGCSLLR